MYLKTIFSIFLISASLISCTTDLSSQTTQELITKLIKLRVSSYKRGCIDGLPSSLSRKEMLKNINNCREISGKYEEELINFFNRKSDN